MEIRQKEEGSKGVFYVEQETKMVAQMTYNWAGTDRIIIDHTAVDDSLKGSGIGKQLVRRAVEFARKKGIKIIPLCPFARSVFDKELDYNDVL